MDATVSFAVHACRPVSSLMDLDAIYFRIHARAAQLYSQLFGTYMRAVRSWHLNFAFAFIRMLLLLTSLRLIVD